MLAKPMRSRHDFNQLIMPPVSRLETALSATVSCHLRVKSPRPSCTPSALIHPAPSHLLITAALSVRPSIHHPSIHRLLLLQGREGELLPTSTRLSQCDSNKGLVFSSQTRRLKYFFIHFEICGRIFPFFNLFIGQKSEVPTSTSVALLLLRLHHVYSH